MVSGQLFFNKYQFYGIEVFAGDSCLARICVILLHYILRQTLFL